MARYQLTPKALDVLRERLKTVEGASELTLLLNVKERQIANLINNNSQILTMVCIVEYIKEHGIKSESLILKKI
jgi:hypothetical protein